MRRHPRGFERIRGLETKVPQQVNVDRLTSGVIELVKLIELFQRPNKMEEIR